MHAHVCGSMVAWAGRACWGEGECSAGQPRRWAAALPPHRYCCEGGGAALRQASARAGLPAGLPPFRRCMKAVAAEPKAPLPVAEEETPASTAEEGAAAPPSTPSWAPARCCMCS